MDNENQMCFACGRQNPIGLQLTFWEQDDQYRSIFTPGLEHQGYDGVMHGGLVGTLLDEITARYIYAKGLPAVTARLEVRYRQPTPVGQPLTLVGWIEKQRGRMYEMAGEVRLADGTVTAECKSLVVVTKG